MKALNAIIKPFQVTERTVKIIFFENDFLALGAVTVNIIKILKKMMPTRLIVFDKLNDKI